MIQTFGGSVPKTDVGPQELDASVGALHVEPLLLLVYLAMQ